MPLLSCASYDEMSSPSITVCAPMPPEPQSITANAVYAPNCDSPTHELPGHENTPAAAARPRSDSSSESDRPFEMASHSARPALDEPSMCPHETGAGTCGLSTVPGGGSTSRIGRKRPKLVGTSHANVNMAIAPTSPTIAP